MKRILKNITFIAFLSASLTACKTEVEPVNEIDETAALNTREDVLVYLTGCYDGLGSVDLEGGAVQFTSELLGDGGEVSFTGTFANLDEIYTKELTTGNTQVTATWTAGYRTINRCNNVLSALDKFADEEEKKVVEGEALFIRGLVYFDLVNLFAKTWGDGDNNTNPGIPIVTEPTRGITEADFRARNSVTEVYNLILADLLKAEIELADQNTDFTRATGAAASAILSRVYLMQANYPAALEKAQSAIDAKGGTGAGSFSDIFDETSGGYGDEIIFAMAVTAQDGSNAMNTYFASEDFQGRGDIPVQQKHLNLYGANDDRKDFFSGSGTSVYTNKFNDQYGDVPIVRISEMYLTIAECQFRANNKQAAADALNITYTRATTEVLTPADLTTVDVILKERHLELAFEGRLLFDKKRNRESITTSLPFNSPKLILPIPQREIDTNKSLQQNQGY